MKVKDIKWGEISDPNDDCAYTHVVGIVEDIVFLITWKGWKD